MANPLVSISPSFSDLVSTKLTTNNYMLWKVQISTYLKGKDMFFFVDVTEIPPPKMIPSENHSSPKTNPDYLVWRKTDQLILSILFSSITNSIISHVISTGTFCELWITLESMFNSHSQTK